MSKKETDKGELIHVFLKNSIEKKILKSKLHWRKSVSLYVLKSLWWNKEHILSDIISVYVSTSRNNYNLNQYHQKLLAFYFL